MLIQLPPPLETAAHADDVFKSILDQKRGRAETAVTVITINHNRFFLVGLLNEFLNVAIVQTNRAGDMRLAVRGRIANIDEQALFLIEPLSGVVNLYLRDIHTEAPRLTAVFYQARTELSTAKACCRECVLGLLRPELITLNRPNCGSGGAGEA